MLAPVIHILPVTLIRRERVLPVPGKVIVRAGQKVGATDIVAEAKLHPEHLLLDIARGLGVPSSKADRYIHCQAGDQLVEGDIIAGPLGLARRVVRTPRDGQVVLAGSGQVLIELAGEPFQLMAGLSGEVVELVAERGAIIETSGALIQGMWGNGRINFGLLNVQAKTPEQVLTADRINVSLRGSVVMGAFCEDAEVLKNAEELPLRGLILASMATSLIPVAAKLRIPVILLEGFGHCPMNPVAFKLLSTSDRREVALNAARWDRYAGTRPEIVISVPGPESMYLPPETATFTTDQQVRIARAPQAGKIGVIVGLKGKVEFPSGLRAQAAEIRLVSGEICVQPLANLEILA